MLVLNAYQHGYPGTDEQVDGLRSGLTADVNLVIERRPEAITVARSLSDTFAGIAPHDVPMFIAAQLVGAVSATIVGSALFPPQK